MRTSTDDVTQFIRGGSNAHRDEITLIKTRPLEILSPREVLPFEITPFMLYLTRMP